MHLHTEPAYQPERQLKLNPLMASLKLQISGLLYSNAVIGTLAVDGWAVTIGAAKRGLGGLRPRPVPSSVYQLHIIRCDTIITFAR